MPNASLSFLPWVRQGAAAAITTQDSLSTTNTAVTTVDAAVTLNGDVVPGVSVRLRGPSDVIGIDANQIVRTDPRPNTHDFEPNCFPSIEFDRPDFPWLFTPAKANDNTQLRPWVCLVVIKKQPGVSVTSTPDRPLPALNIASPAKPFLELPNLKDVAMWAHAQAAALDSTEQPVRDALNGPPDQALSRLVCPRILEHDTDYIACVVPTFDYGRLAGLGLPIIEADLSKVNTLTPAWTLTATTPANITLPVYYQWEFRTGQSDTFESIARRLKASVPAGLGTRTINVSQPGFDAGGATTVELEGALLPIPAATAPPPVVVALPVAFKTVLASIINEPDRALASDPNSDPLLAPPLYGRWHAGQTKVSPTGTLWLDQLNLDPRGRVPAAFGTRVIQEHQEALMASAWEQAAELPTVNQRLRQLQLSLAVNQTMYNRHFVALSEEKMLRIAAPAFGRIQHGNGLSLLANQKHTTLPVAANRSAMRRIGRLRGPLTRRVMMQGFSRSSEDSWVARLNNLPFKNPPTFPPVPPPLDYVSMPTIALFNQQLMNGASLFGVYFVSAENVAATQPGIPVNKNPGTETPDLFRDAAIQHQTKFVISHPQPPQAHHIFMDPIKPLVLDGMLPQTAFMRLVRAVITTNSTVLPPTAPGVPSTGMELVMAPPYFPQPMYEALRDISQDLLLPGLEKVTPDTVVGLQTNRAFVESYMVGLNHEMGRELLWRGYPTDQRATYFDHFWGLGVPNTALRDINALNTWGTRALGDAAGAPSDEEFVMLIRSTLLQRYPNAIIYLTPAIQQPGAPPGPTSVIPDETFANEEPPIFSGFMPPDVSFFGFPITTAQAIGGGTSLGYYVVIQEHPTEPRFGLDTAVTLPAGTTHLAIGTGAPTGVQVPLGRTWGKNSAEMASITRRLPVRVAIHASRLITPA